MLNGSGYIKYTWLISFGVKNAKKNNKWKQFASLNLISNPLFPDLKLDMIKPPIHTPLNTWYLLGDQTLLPKNTF